MSDTAIRIQRWAAHGDVVAATAVATKLHEQGITVDFFTTKLCQEELYGHPHIRRLYQNIDAKSPELHACLDNEGGYESHPDRKTKHFIKIFLESAQRQLAKHGVKLDDHHNATPVLRVTDDEKKAALEVFQKYPKPWVVIIPRSLQHAGRQVPDGHWSRAAAMGPGTWFWGARYTNPWDTVNLNLQTIRQLMGFLSVADVCVTVDTGPMHFAAALGTPVVAIAQQFTPALRLTDQRDFTVIKPDLECLNCQNYECPIDAKKPPCQNVPPERIAQAVLSKWLAYTGKSVSAIIPVYRPDWNRVRKCVDAVKGQVDEVLIALDGDTAPPGDLFPTTKIRIVSKLNREREGFGHTVNRAARQTNGRHLLLLNDDVYCRGTTVKHLVKAMTDGVAVTAGLLRYPDGTIQHGGGVRAPGSIGWGHLDHRKLDPTIKEKTELEFVTMACALVRREVFYQLKAFDERYDCYSEDADFQLRAREKGWKVVYEPKSVAVHDESQTTGPIKQKLFEASHAAFRQRWEPYFKKNDGNQMGAF